MPFIPRAPWNQAAGNSSCKCSLASPMPSRPYRFLQRVCFLYVTCSTILISGSASGHVTPDTQMYSTEMYDCAAGTQARMLTAMPVVTGIPDVHQHIGDKSVSSHGGILHCNEREHSTLHHTNTRASPNILMRERSWTRKKACSTCTFI